MASPKSKPRTRKARRPPARRTASREAARLHDVHHQIKNSLQGIAGLLRLHAARRPDAAEALEDAIRQVHAIAHVYSLYASEGKLRLGALIGAIVDGLRPVVPIELRYDGIDHQRDWVLPEREGVPIAMVANELICHTVRQLEQTCTGPVLVRLTRGGRGEAILQVRRRGTPSDSARGGTPDPDDDSLNLVRSLLPPHASSLAMGIEDGWLCGELRLRPPAVRAPRR